MADTDSKVFVDEDGTDASEELYVWRYVRNISRFDHKRGVKNSYCMFWGRDFSGISSTRAIAHSLGRKVMGQNKTGLKACLVRNQGDHDTDRSANLKWARYELSIVVLKIGAT